MNASGPLGSAHSIFSRNDTGFNNKY
jgi:hypothetical protein